MVPRAVRHLVGPLLPHTAAITVSPGPRPEPHGQAAWGRLQTCIALRLLVLPARRLPGEPVPPGRSLFPLNSALASLGAWALLSGSCSLAPLSGFYLS